MMKRQIVRTKKQKDTHSFNPRLLNINTILKVSKQEKNINEYENQIKNENENEQTIDDITQINNIFNNNLNMQNKQNSNKINKTNKSNKSNTNNINNYNIVKYLGEGNQGSLYLANDLNKKRYICKKINLVNNSNNITNQLQQLEFELNILKYLSSNKITKEYVNPCLEYKIFGNQVFTIFPIFDGYSLNHLSNYLKKLNTSSYYKIIFHLIKTILFGLSTIHQSKIAHQNINNNSILVSTYTKPKEIVIKFTDFGLGCGKNMISDSSPNAMKGSLININEYENENSSSIYKNKYNYNSCKKQNFAPVTITTNVIDQLTDLDHLFIAQKYDLLCLGIIFIKLLLFFENINVNLQNGYSNNNKNEILDLINNKYLSKINVNDKSNKQYKSLFPFINIEDEDELYHILSNIIEYLEIFKEFILCKTENRKTCQYILDKLIIYEKYKNDEF